MHLQILNISIVLAGRNYAPAIFTPDYLRSIKAIKKSWELTDVPTVNPLNTVLKFNNGIVFIVNQEHIQVVDGQPSENVKLSSIPSIMSLLIKQLGYARHRAIGININAFIEYENAPLILREKFLKDGPWVEQDYDALTVQFAYPKQETTLNLTYGSGNAQLAGDSQQRPGIAISANYHTEISASLTLDASLREIKMQIERFGERENDFRSQVEKVFALGGSGDAKS